MIVPAIFLLAVLVFFFSVLTPGDRVDAYLELKGTIVSDNTELVRQDYIDVAKSLNMDMPLFYFGIKPRLYPDTLYKYTVPSEKNLIVSLLNKSGNWKSVERLITRINDFSVSLSKNHDSIKTLTVFKQFNHNFIKFRDSESSLDFDNNYHQLLNSYVFVKDKFPKDISNAFEDLEDNYKAILTSEPKLLDLLPSFAWYGANNRFHNWFGKVLKLDFGISAIDGRSVSEKIWKSLKWTLIYVILAYILTFGLAIPFGIFTAYYDKKRFVKLLDMKFMAFYSVPIFWLATLAVVFLTSSEISSIFNFFPSIGIGDINSGMSEVEKLQIAIPHMILPAIVVAIHTGAYISTLIKRNMLKEMDKDYFTALLSRGISKKSVVIKHIFPNSLLPLITLIVVGLPMSLAGSVIIEVIFNIPGMGRLLYDSILRYDWNVVYAIVLMIGVATYISYLVGDILYTYFNPKIKLA